MISDLFTEKQQEIIAFDNKHHPIINIFHGPVRSGKTHIAIWLFFIKIAQRADQGLNFMITGHSIGSIARNVLKDLSTLFGIKISLNNLNSFKMLGNTVHCFGADDQSAFKAMTGVTMSGWYGNEVTLQHENTISEAFARCSTEDFFIIWDTNPDRPGHPIKKMYIDKSGERLKNGRLWIKAWHFELDDNTFLDEVYKDSLKRATPAGVFYDRKIRGLWVLAEGSIFPQFNRDKHVCDPFDIPKEWTKYRAIDLGFNNPFCCLWGALSPDDVLYIYDIHYEARQLIKYHSKKIKERDIKDYKNEEDLDQKYNTQKCDMRYTTVRDHDAQQGAELEDNGIYTSPAIKDVLDGIQKVGRWLNLNEQGKPKIQIFSTCKKLIEELEGYCWKKQTSSGEQKEEPIKVNDHAVDGLRYMVQEIEQGGLQFWAG